MRFAIIGPSYPLRGGIAHYTTMLTEQLRQAGHGATLYAFTGGYPAWLYPGQTDRDPSSQPLRTDARYLIDPRRPWSWPGVAALIAAERPDLVVLEWWVPYWAPLAWTLARELRRRGVPVLFDCQNVLPHERHPGDRCLTAWALSAADAALVYSPAHEQELLGLAAGIPRALVPFPAYSGLAQHTPDPLAVRQRLGIDGPLALFFGFVRPYKGLDVLLHAMAQALPRRPLHLLVAGEFWHDRARYLTLIAQLGLHRHVTVIDRYLPDEELADYVAAADVLVLPYLAPVQSGVLAVAHAFGKPVIASRVAGLAEGVAEGRSGLLVAPGDPRALAHALLTFFAADLGAAMAPHLRALRPEATWATVVRALVELAGAAQAGQLAGYRRSYLAGDQPTDLAAEQRAAAP